MKIGESTRRRNCVVETKQAHHDGERSSNPVIESVPGSEGDTHSAMKTEVIGNGVGDCGKEIGVFHIERNHGEGGDELKEERDLRILCKRENQGKERKENGLFMNYT